MLLYETYTCSLLVLSTAFKRITLRDDLPFVDRSVELEEQQLLIRC